MYMKDMNRESSSDLKYSLKLLFKNYKPFLKVQLFAILLTLIIFFVIVGIGFVYWLITGKTPENEPFRYIGGAFIAIFSGFIWVFLTTANGLAVDIIDSGDEFTEFRNAFKYLSKHWWKYALTSLVVFGFPNAIQGMLIHPRVQGALQDMTWDKVLIYETLGLVLSYLFYSLFMLVFPSITSQGKLNHAFTENYRILQGHAGRVFGTWALFFLAFQLPIYIFGSLSLILHTPFFGIFWIIFMLINMFIGMPLQYIVGAGMYYNVEFERFKPID